MTKTTKDATPARDTLVAHRAKLDASGAEIAAVTGRRAQFVRDLATDRGRVSDMDAAKAAKKTDMGRVALGEAPAELLESIKSELAAATAEMPAVLQRIELAEAAIELLDAKLGPLHEAHRRLTEATDALEYAARIELAESRVEAYLAAFSRLAQAHANLLGACLAADDFSRPHEGRPEVRAALYQTQLGLPLPKLPSLGKPGITLDLSKQIAEALAKVPAELAEATE